MCGELSWYKTLLWALVYTLIDSHHSLPREDHAYVQGMPHRGELWEIKSATAFPPVHKLVGVCMGSSPSLLVGPSRDVPGYVFKILRITL